MSILTDKTKELTETKIGREALDLFTQAAMISRSMMAARLGKQFNGDRDLYNAFGYVFSPTIEDFKPMYLRQGLAHRAVNKFADDTWNTPPVLIDGESRSDNEEGQTPFIKAWNELTSRLNIWGVFRQADIMCGFGRYSVILLGAPGKKLDEPAGKNLLSYMMPFDEGQAQIHSYIENMEDPQFGMPKFYNVNFTDPANGGILLTPSGGNQVHYTRVIHILRDELGSRVFGTPTLQTVINRLFDLEKVTGGGAEAAWLSVFKGILLSAKDGASLPAKNSDEETYLLDQMYKLVNKIQRYAIVSDVDVKDLGADAVHILEIFKVLIADFCGSLGIPQRILIGSEAGELASSQDQREWNGVIKSRRTTFAEPAVLIPFIRWCITHNALPPYKAKKIKFEWQDVYPETLKEKADRAQVLANGASSVTGGVAERALDINEWRTVVNLPARTEEEMQAFKEKEAEQYEEKLELARASGKDDETKKPQADEKKTAIKQNALLRALNGLGRLLNLNAFYGHKGRPGLRGGSLPKGAGGVGALRYRGHNAPGLTRYTLRDEDYKALDDLMEFESKDAKEALERAGETPENARRRINEARKQAASLPQTRDKYVDANGVYTPERKALHDRIKNGFLSRGTVNENGKPELFMTGGLPGAGKSNVLKTEMYAGYKSKFVVIDSDNIKEILAEADGLKTLGVHAASYHAEADDIISDIFSEAIDKRMNIGLDGTMKNSSKMLSMVDAFKARGYSVEVAFVDLPTDKAMLRGAERFLRGGRFVDPIYIASNDHKNIATAYLLRDRVDVWRYWNNDVPFGTPPILVEERIN